MRTSILTLEDRLRQRLQRVAVHARRHAVGDEIDQVERLCQAVVEGDVSVRAALDALSALRARQSEAA